MTRSCMGATETTTGSRRSVWWLSLSLFAAACTNGELTETIETGPPIAADAMCDELAEAVCDADETCCGSEPMPDCIEVQRERCEDSLGVLLRDPRVGYVPERGGALLAKVRTRAAGCWDAPLELRDLDVVFEGTTASGSDCSPRVEGDTTSSAELHRAAVACDDGTTCRIRLDWDGSPIGTCEPRSEAGEERCSHPYDCGRGAFCNLTETWRIGEWSTCSPLRGDGWGCTQDFECEAGYCGAGVCGVRPEVSSCLAIDYPTLVLASEPVAFYRLGERSGVSAEDASIRREDARYEGTVAHAEEGALASDGALVLDAMGGHLTADALAALGAGGALTVELWVALPEGEGARGGPLFALSDADASIGLSLSSSGLLRAQFLEADVETPAELATPDGAVGAGFHQVALVVDETSVAIFVDGVSIATLAGARALPEAPELVVGAQVAEDPAMSIYFAGALDELAIYDAALTVETLASHVRVAREGPIENDFVLFAWSR